MAERLAKQPQEVERLRLARSLGQSYKRLHGWEPRRTQRGYDREGQRVALADAWEIVVETEPEWDDEERGRMLSLGRYENGVHECGFHTSIANDPTIHFTFEDDTCILCRGAAQYARIQEANDKQIRKSHGENPPPGTPDPADGRTTRARIMSPAEVEARRAQ